jgi:hypothetical protein
MAQSFARFASRDSAAAITEPASVTVATRIVPSLRPEYPVAVPDGADGQVLPAAGAGRIGFISRCIVLQAIGGAFLAALWFAGLAQKPFEGDNAFLCWLIVAMAALGVACVFMQRWNDVQWIATHVVRIGLLGTVVGLIVAFSAATAGGPTDPSAVKPMIAAVVSGMYVALYATLLGIGTNLWLKINLRLLGNVDG